MKGSNQALLVEHFGQIDAHEHRAGAKGHPRAYCTIPGAGIDCDFPRRRPTAIRISHEHITRQ
jgi:hypothetical protein